MGKKKMTAIEEVGKDVVVGFIELYFDSTFKTVCKRLKIKPFEYKIVMSTKTTENNASTTLKPITNEYIVKFDQKWLEISNMYMIKRTICHEVAHCISLYMNYQNEGTAFLLKVGTAKDKNKYLHDKTWETIFKSLGYSIDYDY